MIGILLFPLEHVSDAVIERALLPCVDAARAANPTANAIADAAMMLLDPDQVGPALVREACRLVLMRLAGGVDGGGT